MNYTPLQRWSFWRPARRSADAFRWVFAAANPLFCGGRRMEGRYCVPRDRAGEAQTQKDGYLLLRTHFSAAGDAKRGAFASRGTGEALHRRKEMAFCSSEHTFQRRETQRGARLRPVGTVRRGADAKRGAFASRGTGEALCRRKEMAICSSEHTFQQRETHGGALLRPKGPERRCTDAL